MHISLPDPPIKAPKSAPVDSGAVGRWAEVLDVYLPAWLALFLPDLHAEIDWSFTPVFRDGEMQKLIGVRPSARRCVDKLVEVRLSGGEPALLFVHAEVEGRRGADFLPRLYVYHYQLAEAEATLPAGPLLARDARPKLAYRRAPLNGRFGKLEFVFPAVHLAAWRTRRTLLLSGASRNLFALVVLAALEAAEPGTPVQREERKAELVGLLHAQGYGEVTAGRLRRFIDGAFAVNEGSGDQVGPSA